jgi:cell division protein ZapA (FtsZ GTPase activity inhibitor)
MAENKVTVRIYGQDYTITGEKSQAYIERVAQHVDEVMSAISDAVGGASASSLAVLTAVNIADEFFMQKTKQGDFDGEKERLRRIRDTLHIADEDSLWDILTAMEYQRAYYEELPAKIAAASTEILQSLSVAAEKEAGRAQHLLAESVAEQAKRLSLRINMERLLTMGLGALACLLAYGSLSMWAGFHMGSGHAQSPVWLLRVPSGVLMGGLFLAGGLFLGVRAGSEFAEVGKGWKKSMAFALAMLVAGGVIVSLAL